MKIDILPETIALPARPQSRRHEPQRGTRKQEWEVYLDCLRWDFGFTCAFCMLHESDLAEHGAGGEGMLWIEHLTGRSHDEARANDYTNTFLSCRFCNNSRGTQPAVDKTGRSLLDPTRVAWADHFTQVGDSLQPRDGDANALYTWTAYQLDHAKKIERRQHRRERIGYLRFILEFVPTNIEELDEIAHKAQQVGKISRARKALEASRKWQAVLAQCVKDIERYRAIPHDAPTRCRCGDDDLFRLPAWLAEQLVTVELPG